jgi:ABC-type uncharacterized transport system ATPase subunit
LNTDASSAHGDVPGIELRAIIRDFPGGVRALDGANLTAQPGEVHALLGENGAGKSTLAHVLAGDLQPTSGTITVRGKVKRFRSPREAVRASVGIVHQHFKLVPAFTGVENIALWSLESLGLISEDAVRERALAVAAKVGMKIELDRPVSELSVGARQRIEIVKLLYADPGVLVLDEPTAVLAPLEIEDLFATLRALAAEGRVVILIAHKLDEVLSVADRVTVLRAGRTVLEASRADVDADELARAMVGTDVPDPVRRRASTPIEVVARTNELEVRRSDGGMGVRGVSLEVRRGEILGVAGVDGNGQRELALALAGLTPPDSGSVTVAERIGFISQDRSNEGVVGDFSLAENVALAFRKAANLRAGPFIRWERAEECTAEFIARYDVRASGPDARARTLSGGNQQKLIVARELARGADLVIAENPTRGLDIAASGFVRRELVALRDRRDPPGVVLISTDLDEVLEVADRVAVLVRGRLIEVSAAQRTREGIGALMLSASP